MVLDRIAEAYDRMQEELLRESYLLGAGIKEQPEYRRIYESYGDLYSMETITALIKEKLSLHEDAPDEMFDVYDRAIFTLLSLYLSNRLVKDHEEMDRYEMGAVVEVRGKRYPYRMLPLILQKEEKRERRSEIFHASLPIVNRLTDMKLGIYRKALSVVRREFGYPNLLDYHSHEKKEDIASYSKKMEGFLSETYEEYRELAERFFSLLGLGWGEVEGYDIPYLLSGIPFKTRMKVSSLQALRETLKRGGIDVDGLGNLRIDSEIRPKKSPRAFCAPVRIPDEIYVVVKPSGNFSDVLTLFHEMGHALHFAFTDRDLPVVFKRMGRVGTSEVFSFNLQYITDQVEWLSVFVRDLDEEFLRFRRFAYLFYRRRYAAKVIYESRILAGDRWEEEGPRVYEEVLTGATGVHHHPAKYFLDMDWGFYSLEYSQAWEVEVVLRERLREEFGGDWFFKPEAYEFLKSLWSYGLRYPPYRISTGILGVPLS